MNNSRFTDTPYFLLLLLPLISIAWPIMEWRLYPAWLCVPLSVWACYRYGWRGFEMVAIGGLLLPIGVHTSFFTIPSHLDIYLSSLLVSALTAYRRPITDTLKSLEVTPGLTIAVFLLPIYIRFGSQPVFNTVEIYLSVSLLPILFLLMFLLGLAKARIKPLIALLLIATCFGITIRYLDSSGPVGFNLNSLAEYIVAIAWYFFGLHFRDTFKGQESKGFMGRRPRGTIIILLFLWAGDLLWEPLARLAGSDIYWHMSTLMPFGTWYALPLAALYAGLSFRYRGIIIICAVALFYESLGHILEIEHFNLSIPITGAVFALLGLRLIDHINVREIKQRKPRSPFLMFAVLLILGLSLITPIDSVKGLIFFMTLLVLIIFILVLARQVLKKANIDIYSQEWITLCGLIILLSSLLFDIKKSISTTKEALIMLKMVSSGYNISVNMTTIMIVLVYIGALLTAINEIIKRMLRMKKDFSSIRIWAIKCRQENRLVTMPSTREKNDKAVEAEPSKRLKRLIRVLTWLRNAVAAIIVIVFLRFIMMMG